MKQPLKMTFALAALAMASQAIAQVTLYEHDGFRGRSFTTARQVANFERAGFNDRASSVQVVGGRWEVCEDAQFRGRCIVLRPGRYPSLSAMGLNDRLSSVREIQGNARVDERRFAPAADPFYDSRRRNGERLYEARVTSVRAVMATPQQRCWVEREQVVQDRGGANVPAAIAGALIGGVLGHQVGGGSGRDIATAGGAVTGAVVGSRMDGRGGSTQDVQRCANVAQSSQPDYWDVAYSFRGKDHRIQMTEAPDAVVMVNRLGEPRTR